MKRLILLLLLPTPAVAVPVVPNFATGVVTSRTESKTVIKESIVSESYRTGFEYTVSGKNVQPVNGIVSPTPSTNSITFQTRGNWKQTTAGQPFQFAETFSGPGLIEKVNISRETVVEAVVDSTSTFSQ